MNNSHAGISGQFWARYNDFGRVIIWVPTDFTNTVLFWFGMQKQYLSSKD